MVYHRGLWNYYVAGILKGMFHGTLVRQGSLHKTIQLWADGALARFYSISEWKSMVADLFAIERMMIFGSKSEIVALPNGKMKNIIMAHFPNSLSRFLTHRLKMGSFLVSELQKP